MKKVLFTILLGLSSIGLWAVPARPGTMTVSQPDGTTLEIEVSGDEFFHYTTTTDGYLIDRNSEGYFEYATTAGREIRLSGIKVGCTDRNMEKYSLRNNIVALETARQQYIMGKNSPMQRTIGKPMIAKKGLVILVNFSDTVKFTVENPQAAFDSLINQQGYSENGATGSAKDYFIASSNGQYYPEFDIYGPYTLPENMEYYGGDRGNSWIDVNAYKMPFDAVKALAADKEADVDFNDYDQDGDGYIDFVFVYYAGHNQAETLIKNQIWPHQSSVKDHRDPDTSEEFDGKKVDRYACTSEYKGDQYNKKGEITRNMCGIGTFCHEFSHVLGLPDLYTTNYATHKAMGEWDVLATGPYNNEGRTPPTYSAYERFFMGWIQPEIMKADSAYELENLLKSNKALLISETGEHNLEGDDPDPEEFYLLETREAIKGTWDMGLPGSGLLVTKINYNSRTWRENTVNNEKDMMGVDIVEADGIDHERYAKGKRGDIFPSKNSAGEVTFFNAFDKYWLHDITYDETAGTVKFNVKATSVGTDNIQSDSEIFIAGSTVYGLEAGMELRCIDMAGRMLWSDTALSDTYSFDAPAGLYCIIVTKDGIQYEILKSIGK